VLGQFISILVFPEADARYGIMLLLMALTLAVLAVASATVEEDR